MQEHASVAAYLDALDHPLKPALKRVLEAIRKADAAIVEGIKWNAPSYQEPKSGRYFATVNIHGSKKAKDAVLIVLHQDAKAGSRGVSKSSIEDPSGLLDWMGKDRAVVRLENAEQVKSKEAQLTKIVKQWIAQL